MVDGKNNVRPIYTQQWVSEVGQWPMMMKLNSYLLLQISPNILTYIHTFCIVAATEEIAERRVWGDPLKPGQSWNGKK